MLKEVVEVEAQVQEAQGHQGHPAPEVEAEVEVFGAEAHMVAITTQA